MPHRTIRSLCFFIVVFICNEICANEQVGSRITFVQLLSPERQVFVPFNFNSHDQPGQYTVEEARYLTGELNLSKCKEDPVSVNGPKFLGSKPCEWLTTETLSKQLLDVVFSQKYSIKAYQRAVTLIQYNVDGEIRTLPKLYRKTYWDESHAFSNHRFRIDRVAALPLKVDRYQILKAARNASLSEDDINVLKKCTSSNDSPCSTTDEPEFKIELYDNGVLRSAFIVRIKNLK